jgi:hypothetical protein
MLESNGLTVSVSESGIFIHFVASDGSETQIDALTVLVLLTKEAFAALLMLAKRGAGVPASSREALTGQPGLGLLQLVAGQRESPACRAQKVAVDSWG